MNLTQPKNRRSLRLHPKNPGGFFYLYSFSFLRYNINMLKKIIFVLVPIFVIGFFLFPAHQTFGATTATSESETAPAVEQQNKQVEEIKTIIGKNTPNFLAKPIIFIVEALESFRQNNFNNPFIFYGVFFIFLFIIVRAIWRFFFP